MATPHLLIWPLHHHLPRW